MDTASNAALENEFGTHKEEDVVAQILEKGDVQDVEVCKPLFFPLPSGRVLTHLKTGARTSR